MAKQSINIGTLANDGTGTNLRTAGGYINNNFGEIYNALGDGSSITLTSTPTSLNLLNGLSAKTGSGNLVLSTSPSLTTPNFSSIVNTGTLTLPTSTDTLIGRATIDTLTNKTFDTAGTGNVLKINGTSITNTTGTGNAVLATSPTLTTPNFSSIVNTGTLTLPTSTDTLVGRATTDTLTNKTLTSPVISTIVNTGTLTLPTSTDTLVGRATSDTLTNKTLTSPIISSISNTGTLTLPTSSDTLVGRATTDTFTNKTFDTAGTGNVFKINGTSITANTGTGNNVLATSPTLTTPSFSSIVNTGTLTLPTSTDTLVGRATTDSLTNKSFSGSTNSFDVTTSGSKMRFNFANTGSLPSATTYDGMFASISGAATAYVANSSVWLQLVTYNSSIDSLTDVDTTTAAPTYRQVLRWTTQRSGQWEPTSLGAFVKYTGDGSTTAYTITIGYTVAQVLVIVNGLVQTPTDDYTISSTTLTFVTAPANGAKIVIRYLG